MGNKTNAARRVYRLLMSASKHPENAQPPTTLGMWGKVLSGDLVQIDPSAPEYEDSVVPLLTELRRQIRAVAALTKTREDYEELIAALINRASSLTGSQVLHGRWSEIKAQFLKPELISGWGLLASSIPNTDEDVCKEQLTELLAAIQELEQAARASDAPVRLRTFLVEQAFTMREALLRAHISGVEGLRTTLATGLGEFLQEQSSFDEAAKEEPEKTKAAFAQLVRVWHIAADICGDVEKFQNALMLGYGLSDQAQHLIPLVRHLLGGPGG